MAKIKVAGGQKKSPIGPKNPGALGCIILIAAALVVVSLVLYYSLAK